MKKTTVGKIIERVVANYDFSIDPTPDTFGEWEGYSLKCLAALYAEWCSKKWREAAEELTPEKIKWDDDDTTEGIEDTVELKIMDIEQDKANDWFEEFKNNTNTTETDTNYIDISTCEVSA